jgi:hypothetical protein
MNTIGRSIATYWNKGRTSMSIILHRYDKVGTVYLSIVMCTNIRRTCARTIAMQRKWSAISTGILIAVLRAVIIVSTVVLTTTDICTVWCGWQFDNRRQKFVMVKTQHDVQICAVKSEKVSCTKYVILRIVRRVRDERKREVRKTGSVPKNTEGRSSFLRHTASYRCCGFWYDGRWALYKNQCSISWDEMSMIWIDVSFDSSRAVSHWLLEHRCNVLCTRATVIRDGVICKIHNT